MHSKIHSKYYCQVNFDEYCCLKYSGDKLSGICPEFAKVSPIKLSSADINRHYPVIAEFQINA